MSERLLVTVKKYVTQEDSIYDWIYTEEGTLDELLIGWCAYNISDGSYWGPWEVTIRGHEIIDQFMEDFLKLKKYIPELQSLKDCWTVYDHEDLVWANPKVDIEMGKLLYYFDKVLLEEEEQE